MRPRILVSLVLVGAAAAASCTVKKTDAPPLAGPSVMALSLTVAATPDHLSQDGASQSQLSIQARNENGEPVSNLPLRVDLTVGGLIADFGELSAKTLVTNGDGRATAAYTAPPPPPDPVDYWTVITFLVTPIGSDFGSTQPRAVSIRVVPPGVILPPNGTPTADFSFSPGTPQTHAEVFFDASASKDDGAIVSCSWTFGDGATATGMTASHQFRSAGQYSVTLTVTDDRGLSASTTKTVSVTASQLPTASFVFSPSGPGINESILFNAAESKAASGRFIASYNWDFGSGETAGGLTATTKYAVQGTYNVTLTVIDDVGQKAATSKSVMVQETGASTPVAAFTYSPTAPTTTDWIFFDASDSTSPAGITVYHWEWGDATHGKLGRTATHCFDKPGTYIVRLTVTGADGRTASITKNVTVTVPGP